MNVHQIFWIFRSCRVLPVVRLNARSFQNSAGSFTAPPGLCSRPIWIVKGSISLPPAMSFSVHHCRDKRVFGPLSLFPRWGFTDVWVLGVKYCFSWHRTPQGFWAYWTSMSTGYWYMVMLSFIVYCLPNLGQKIWRSFFSRICENYTQVIVLLLLVRDSVLFFYVIALRNLCTCSLYSE